MRLLRSSLLTIAPALAAAANVPVPEPGTGPWCVSTTDLTSKLLRDKLVRIASDTAIDNVRSRAALGGFPLTDASQVVLVDRENVCRQASKELDRSVFASPQHAPVYVIQIGSYYAVVPLNEQSGSVGAAVFMDSTLTKVGVGLL